MQQNNFLNFFTFWAFLSNFKRIFFTFCTSMVILPLSEITGYLVNWCEHSTGMIRHNVLDLFGIRTALQNTQRLFAENIQDYQATTTSMRFCFSFYLFIFFFCQMPASQEKLCKLNKVRNMLLTCIVNGEDASEEMKIS